MSKQIPSLFELKGMAQTLKRAEGISHAEALRRIAARYGYKTWSALKAQVEREDEAVLMVNLPQLDLVEDSSIQPMAAEAFWAIVDRTKAKANKTPSSTLAALRQELESIARNSVTDLEAFQARLEQLLRAAVPRGDLSPAAQVMLGYQLSDDNFSDFLCWLVLQGRAAYEGALANPDNLADVPEDRGLGVALRKEEWLPVNDVARDICKQLHLPKLRSAAVSYAESAAMAKGAIAFVDDEKDWSVRFPKLMARRLTRSSKIPR